MQQTDNYQLQLYEANDAPNLLDGYNASMRALDTQLKTNTDATSLVTEQVKAKAPISHASTSGEYGIGTASQFGHVQLSDSTTLTSNAQGGIAATPYAVNEIHQIVTDHETLIKNNQENITAATTKATTAENTATAAQTTANAAQTTANAAQTTANAAQTTANAAQTTANAARTQLAANPTILKSESVTLSGAASGTANVSVIDSPNANAIAISISGTFSVTSGSATKTLSYTLPSGKRPTRKLILPLYVYCTTDLMIFYNLEIETSGKMTVVKNGTGSYSNNVMGGNAIFFYGVS